MLRRPTVPLADAQPIPPVVRRKARRRSFFDLAQAFVAVPDEVQRLQQPAIVASLPPRCAPVRVVAEERVGRALPTRRRRVRAAIDPEQLVARGDAVVARSSPAMPATSSSRRLLRPWARADRRLPPEQRRMVRARPHGLHGALLLGRTGGPAAAGVLCAGIWWGDVMRDA
jgi:hypothetical protein